MDLIPDNVLSMITLVLLFIIVFRVLFNFSLVFTDTDQELMSYALNEFRAGRFHMPRFFGQDYGSMLEALLAVPLILFHNHTALVIVSSLLLLLPYFLIGQNSVGKGIGRWKYPLLFLSILPLEYFMIGTMPRDFVTGIAVSSLSIPLLKSKRNYSLFGIGFLCILGWSINNNAALLGAVLSIYALYTKDIFQWRCFRWVSGGYLAGFALHLILYWMIAGQPELIVHEAWDFHYAWKQLSAGLQNLDKHWAAITPVFYGKGWIYILLFAALIITSIRTKSKVVLSSTIVLMLLVFATFGLLKVHDGYDNVFSSYERMYLALPVAFIFLRTKLNVRLPYENVVLAGLVLGVGVFNILTFQERLDFQLDPQRERIALISEQTALDARKKVLEELAVKLEVEAIIVGPDAFYLDRLASCGSFSKATQIPIVHPEYERKSWDLRKLDTGGYRRVLWLSQNIEIGKVTDVKVEFEELEKDGMTRYLLLTGDNFNPIEVFRRQGFSVCNH